MGNFEPVKTGTRTSTQSNVQPLLLFGGRLTDVAVKNARARDRAYKKSDGRGLCLLVQPNGAKWWRFRYKWDLANDINPADARRNANLPERMFEAVARHWLGKLAKKVRLGKRSVKTLEKATWALEAYVFPSIGAKHIGSIEPHQHPHLRSTQRTQTAESDAQNGAATLSQPQGRRHDSVSRATPP